MENTERKVIVEINGLSKKYGSNFVLKNINLRIKEGEIMGLVGKNGAGKTTLIREIAGLISPTEGSISLFGENDADRLARVRGEIAAMVETPALHLNMNAHDNLMTRCLLKGMKGNECEEYIKDRLEYVGLGDLYKSKKKVKDFSLGMRQRVGIAMALTGDPKLLILDEPTNGLDPEGIRQIRELLQKINKEQGATIIVSSHILSELSKFATSYVFIDKGEIISESTEEDLERSGGNKVTLSTDKDDIVMHALKENGLKADVEDGKIVVREVADLPKLLNTISASGAKFSSFKEESSDLEQYFVKLLEELK